MVFYLLCEIRQHQVTPIYQHHIHGDVLGCLYLGSRRERLNSSCLTDRRLSDVKTEDQTRKDRDQTCEDRDRIGKDFDCVAVLVLLSLSWSSVFRSQRSMNHGVVGVMGDDDNTDASISWHPPVCIGFKLCLIRWPVSRWCSRKICSGFSLDFSHS